MGEWSPPINQQEEIGREATVEAPSAQTRKDYTSRPGALSRFFRMSRDGWKSKFKDLEATVRGCYLGKEQDHVGQAFQPDGASSSGWKPDLLSGRRNTRTALPT